MCMTSLVQLHDSTMLQVETPLERADRLSEEMGNEILLKREDLQPVVHLLQGCVLGR